jgi:hypothetical protein
MNTVNVIEITDTSSMAIEQLVAFPDDEGGNKKAEELFTALLKKRYSKVPADLREPLDETIVDALDDGWWEAKGYMILIVHSSKPTDED